MVVFAQGPVGLSATIGTRLLGAGRIFTAESKPNRVELSRKFGADVVVDPTRGAPVEQILEMNGGEGVDSAIEALGTPETFANCFRVTRAGAPSLISVIMVRRRQRWKYRCWPSVWV